MIARVSISSTWLAITCLTLVSLLSAGCGGEGYDQSFNSKLDSVDEMLVDDPASQDANGVDAVRLVSDSTNPNKVARRIVYDAELQLVVEQYEEFQKSIGTLVQQHNGFISKSETDRRYQRRQSGTWVARIPVEDYVSFLTAVTALGFPESRSETAKDVTAEYVDIEARIRNNQKLEQRILQMLEKPEGKVTDILEIERELARVRDEIERMQGRMRVLTDQSSLATITIDVREEQEYVPPTAPTLSSRLGATWSASTQLLRSAFEGLLLVAVAMIPWIVTLGVASLILYGIVRSIRRKPV